MTTVQEPEALWYPRPGEPPLGDDVRVDTVRTLDELEALRDEWLPHRVEHHDASGLLPRGHRDRATGGGAVRRRPRRDGRLEAMLLARFERIPLPCKLGYRTVYAPRCARSRSSTRATSATSTSTARGSLPSSARRSTAATPARAALPPPERGPPAPPGRDDRRRLSRQRMARRMTCWERTLPPTYDEFLARCRSRRGPASLAT